MPSNSWFPGTFWDHNPRGMTIDSAIFAQVTAECPYTLLWALLSLKIVPSNRGSGVPSNTWLLGPIWAHNPNGISISSAVIAQMTIEYPYILQWDAPSHLKIAPYHGGSGPPSNTWFPGSTRVLNPKGISISSTISAGLTSVPDRPTSRLVFTARLHPQVRMPPVQNARRMSRLIPSSEHAQIPNFRTRSIPNLWTRQMSSFWTYLFAARLCHTLPASIAVL